MSGVTALSVGIECISTLSVAERSDSSLDCSVLPPNGEAVIVHLEALYPHNDSQHQMMAFADPGAVLAPFGKNSDFRRDLFELSVCLRCYQDNQAIAPAIGLLEKLNTEQSLLQMMLHLLHRA